MHFHVITLMPEMFRALDYGVTGRAINNGLLNVTLWNPRDYTSDKHRCVDDRPYGGGPGMVMMAQPLQHTIHAAKARIAEQNEAAGDAKRNAATPKVAMLTPGGKRLDQNQIKKFATQDSWILIAGRYEGVDQRLIDLEVDEQWSIGDYVLSGGEIPAMVVIDAMTRLQPGVLGNEASLDEESFQQGLLDFPHYTRPDEFAGREVPPVLKSGDHAKIARWREQQALGLTWRHRPDLLAQANQGKGLTPQQQQLLKDYMNAVND